MPELLLTTVMNVSKEAMRTISFPLSLYLFVSIMIMDGVYSLRGSAAGSGPGDQEVGRSRRRDDSRL